MVAKRGAGAGIRTRDLPVNSRALSRPTQSFGTTGLSYPGIGVTCHGIYILSAFIYHVKAANRIFAPGAPWNQRLLLWLYSTAFKLLSTLTLLSGSTPRNARPSAWFTPLGSRPGGSRLLVDSLMFLLSNLHVVLVDAASLERFKG